MNTWCRPLAGALLTGALALSVAVPVAAVDELGAVRSDRFSAQLSKPQADRWGLFVGEWSPQTSSEGSYAASPFSRHRAILIGGGGSTL